MSETVTTAPDEASSSAKVVFSGADEPEVNIPLLIERNRRRGIERIIDVSRWMIILIAAIYTNYPNSSVPHTVEINLVLSIWAALNLIMTLFLLRNKYPTVQTQSAWIGIDVIIAAGLLYLSGGITSQFAVILFVVILMGTLRVGLVGSVASLLGVSILYLGICYALSHGFSHVQLVTVTTAVFLFVIVTVITNLVSRELITSQEQLVAHSFSIETSALNELRDIERAKGEFMMLASHELRTPLTKIKAWLSLMEEAGDRLPPSAREEAMVELHVEADHLARLTDNLLSISQLQTGEIRLKTSTVDLDSCFREVLNRFVDPVDRERFNFQLDPEAITALADHDRLILALGCLIDNALKFSPNHEIVNIQTTRQVRHVRIEITDHGRRIPNGDINKVFASFYQVESPLVRQRGGFGVGLYLSRQLVEHMGGSIGIDNTRGVHGNTFFIELHALA